VRDDVGAYNVYLSVTKHTYQSQRTLASHKINLTVTMHCNSAYVINRLSCYPQHSKVHAIVIHKLLVLYKSQVCGQVPLALWTTSAKG
jgi:hypothetical protein